MYQPKIIFFMEIKDGDAFCERIQEQVSSAYYVNPKGISGGIVLCWRDDVFVAVKATTQNIIDYEVTSRTQD